jgi:hypothetical protein
MFISCAFQRSPRPGFSFSLQPVHREVDKEKYAMYFAVCFGTPEEMEILLKAGQNPNRMRCPPGSIPWHDTCPLWLVKRTHAKAELLIRYGADVTRRPYLYKLLDSKIVSERFPNEELLEYVGTRYEKEMYELVKLFLDAGADPNFRGGSNVMLFIPTDANYRRLFQKYGSLPINNAIEFNAFSIVDLLLEHGAMVDEESLECAKEAANSSGHTDMEEYIKAVWEKQQRTPRKP